MSFFIWHTLRGAELLRYAIGDKEGGDSLIETSQRRGYMFESSYITCLTKLPESLLSALASSMLSDKVVFYITGQNDLTQGSSFKENVFIQGQGGKNEIHRRR